MDPEPRVCALPLSFEVLFFSFSERERERERERAGKRGRGREREYQDSTLSREPDTGLNPKTLGS